MLLLHCMFEDLTSLVYGSYELLKNAMQYG